MSDRSTKDASSSKRERSHHYGKSTSTRLFAAAKAREAEARIGVLKKKLEALQEKHRLEEESAEMHLKEENEKRRREIEEIAQRERQKRSDIELWNELEEEATHQHITLKKLNKGTLHLELTCYRTNCHSFSDPAKQR